MRRAGARRDGTSPWDEPEFGDWRRRSSRPSPARALSGPPGATHSFVYTGADAIVAAVRASLAAPAREAARA